VRWGWAGPMAAVVGAGGGSGGGQGRQAVAWRVQRRATRENVPRVRACMRRVGLEVRNA